MIGTLGLKLKILLLFPFPFPNRFPSSSTSHKSLQARNPDRPPLLAPIMATSQTSPDLHDRRSLIHGQNLIYPEPHLLTPSLPSQTATDLAHCQTNPEPHYSPSFFFDHRPSYLPPSRTEPRSTDKHSDRKPWLSLFSSLTTSHRRLRPSQYTFLHLRSFLWLHQIRTLPHHKSFSPSSNSSHGFTITKPSSSAPRLCPNLHLFCTLEP